MSKGFDHLSFLDLLRPDPGWQTDHATFASYSADPVVMVACLLALSGVDHDEGGGNRIEFATAHEKLAGKVKFVIQAGRLVQPANRPTVLGILDDYVTEVQVDEHNGSWHPKMALVRYHREVDQAVTWRFWMGSRNLTRDLSFDMGMSLQGSDQGDAVTGLPETCIRLARHAGLPGMDLKTLESELSEVLWVAPQGCAVESVNLWEPGEKVSFPDAPPELAELLVVSPFLDGSTTGRFKQWGDEETSRFLLSSPMELNKLALQKEKPLQTFADNVLFLDRPDFDPASIDPEEEISRGLHAKIICCKCQTQNLMWMGSPNMTQRAWGGGNFEAVAKIKVDDDLYDRLHEFVSTGALFDPTTAMEEEADLDQERLEEARKSVAAQWTVHLDFTHPQPVLVSENNLDFISQGVELRVGLFAGDQVHWKHGEKRVTLPEAAPYQMTKLLRLTLTCNGSEVSWLQTASTVEGLPEDRDQQMMAHYLRPNVFLQWLRALLQSDAMPDGGGAWDEETTQQVSHHKSHTGREQIQAWAPSLEEILRAWARDASTLSVADHKVRMYAKYLSGDSSEESEVKEFQTFLTTWKLIVQELPLEVPHG